MESIAIWLILRDSQDKNKVLLQRRAEKDGQKPQSFPFVLQPTFNGKLEKGEHLDDAINREASEELGGDFVLPKLTPFFKENYEFKDTAGASHNYFGFIGESDLKKIKIHSGAYPEFVFLNREDLSRLKTVKSGADPKNELVLFDDQLEAIKELFKIIP